MKKFVIIGLIGAVISIAIDSLLGIDLTKSHGYIASLVHNVTYMMWGSFLLNKPKT